MVYLDYSATTKIFDEALDTYDKVSKDFFANPNSIHSLGLKSKKLIDASLNKISSLLNIREDEITFTSGASEANNTAIKGICHKYKNRGNHIITTALEHSSVIEPLNFLKEEGFTFDFVPLDKYGRVNLKALDEMITDKTILVSINSVSSELGICQPLEEISKIIKKHKNCFFHCDVTQSIGKHHINFSLFDLASFSGQKFFGPRGIGVLYVKKGISITPLIHGGKSTNNLRSGTPNTPLIASMCKSLSIILENLDKNYEYVTSLNKYLIEKLKSLDVTINSNKYSIPHIVNFSLHGIKSETMVHALEADEIYVSTTTACNTNNYSESVYRLTNDLERAKNTIRVSISYATTKEEIDFFIEKLKLYIDTL